MVYILATPVEIEANKVVRRIEQTPVQSRTPGDLSDLNLLGVLALTVLNPVMLVESKDISLRIIPASQKCSSNA